MDTPITPSKAALASAELNGFDDEGTVQIARLITKGSTGSELMTGACTVHPGADVTWTQADDTFETYYVVRGRVRVSWSHPDSEPTVAELGADEVLSLPPGWTYRLEAVGQEEAFLVYSLIPPAA